MSSISEHDFEACPLFRDMLPEEREHVVKLLSIEDYGPGDMILEEGLSQAVIWIVVKGSCKVIKRTKDGGHQELAVIEPMQTFGEMSFFHSAPHSASVQALSEVTVARLDRARYHSLIDIGSQAAFKIAFNTIGVLAERLRVMDDWTRDLVESGAGRKGRQEWGDFRSKLYSEWQF